MEKFMGFIGLFPLLFAKQNGIDPSKVRWIRIIESVIGGAIVGLLVMYGSMKVIETKMEFYEKQNEQLRTEIMSIRDTLHNHMLNTGRYYGED